MSKRKIIKLVYVVLLVPILTIMFGNNSKNKTLDNTILRSKIIKDNMIEIQENINNLVVEESIIAEIKENDRTLDIDEKDIVEKIEVVEQKQSIIQNQKQDNNNQNSENSQNSNSNYQDTKETQNQGTQENLNQKNEQNNNVGNANIQNDKEIKNEIKQITTEKQKIYTYEKNETECEMLKSEFERITGNNPSFSVEIKEKAKDGYSFYPYRESEIKKQIKNLTFGSFEVYAEDVSLNGVKQRTIYYIY